MLQVEKKSLVQFVLLYVISTSSFLIALSVIYFNYQKNVFLENKRSSMQIYSEKVVNSVYDIKRPEEIELYYSEDKRFDIAIFDNKKKVLFSTFKGKVDLKKSFYGQGEYMYYVDKIELEYLNAKYIVVRGYNIEPEIAEIKQHLYLTSFLSLVFIIVLAYLLSKMFLKPIRNYISKIDDFIKDTTHELNTPLSTIMMSIETIDKTSIDAKLLKKIVRIDNAAKAISSLYQDLSFLALHGKNKNKDELVDVGKMVGERIEYFESLADVKGICFDFKREDSYLFIDKNRLRIVIDNLISNAIKYNKTKGHIAVFVSRGVLRVADEGSGIPKDKIKDIFARYSRFDDANGGFGIGLNIVQMICSQYGILIEVESTLHVGTIFTLTWNSTAQNQK